MTQTFEEFIEQSGNKIDFTPWTQDDKLELYFGALDSQLTGRGSY